MCGPRAFNRGPNTVTASDSFCVTMNPFPYPGSRWRSFRSVGRCVAPDVNEQAGAADANAPTATPPLDVTVADADVDVEAVAPLELEEPTLASACHVMPRSATPQYVTVCKTHICESRKGEYYNISNVHHTIMGTPIRGGST